MAIFIDQNRKVKNIFVNVNGGKKSIISAWGNKNGIPTKVFQSDNSEIDPYKIAPENEYNNWNYTLDEGNNVITFNYYTGSVSDVIVYANYVIGGKIYKTQIKDSTYSSDLNGWPTNYMFANRDNIKTIKFSNSLDTGNLTNMNFMFSQCTGVVSIDFGNNFDTSNVTEMVKTFYNCRALTTLDLCSFDTGNVTNMSSMFYCCNALAYAYLNVSSFDTSKVTNMNSMFYNCVKLTTLDLSSFDTSKVTNMNNMFYNCRALKTIYVTQEKWSILQASKTNMFYSCGTSSVTYK